MVEPVIIGDCQLYLGDCFEILPTLDIAKVNVVVTDPPYRIKGKGGGLGSNRKYLKEIVDNKLEDGFDARILSGFGSWAVFCSKNQIVELIEQAQSQGFNWQIITWNKPNPTPLTYNNYLPDTEYIIHAYCAGGIYGGYQDKSRFIIYPARAAEYDHPTVKPIAVMSKIIKTASDTAHIVLDPFMGTASTGIACINAGRKFIGIEIEPKYFDIACKRIEDAYKQPDMFIAPIATPQQMEVFL